MAKKVCSECRNPLRIVAGGNKIKDGEIVNVQVLGCMNPDCSIKMQEQDRREIPIPSFEG